MSVQEIGRRLEIVRQRIAVAERRAGRPAGSVALVAVSKTRPTADLLEAIRHGQRRFGESYVQEALPKIEALSSAGLEWHFIGALQANKTKKVSRHFQWVHSVDSAALARRLSTQRPPDLAPLNVCLQVNIDRESTKQGACLEDLPELVEVAASLPRLCLRGLMAMPAHREGFEERRLAFRPLREARDRLRTSTGVPLDTLSMGMTADLEAAITEGATLVRVGTAIFGPRAFP